MQSTSSTRYVQAYVLYVCDKVLSVYVCMYCTYSRLLSDFSHEWVYRTYEVFIFNIYVTYVQEITRISLRTLYVLYSTHTYSSEYTFCASCDMRTSRGVVTLCHVLRDTDLFLFCLVLHRFPDETLCDFDLLTIALFHVLLIEYT